MRNLNGQGTGEKAPVNRTVRLTALAHDLPGSRIDIDKDHTTIADELQAIDHRCGIVLGAKVLHALLGGQHAPFDIAQRSHIARAKVLAGLVLFIGPLLCVGGRRKHDQRSGKEGNSAFHDERMPKPDPLNKS